VANWQTEAERAAQHVGVDPDLFKALVWQESRGDANAQSKAGALGYTQLMPGTAQGLGVNPHDPWQNLVGGAKYLKQQMHAFGGDVSKALAAYNAGPGAVQKYGGVPPFAETQAYVKAITGALGKHTASAPKPGKAIAPAVADPVSALTASTTNAGPQTDATGLIQLASQQRQAPASSSAGLPVPAVLSQAYRALSSGQAPAPRRDVSALIDAARTPGQEAADVAQQASPLVASASAAPASTPASGKGGADAALSWAQSKIGSKETGTNSGGLASYLNQRFGMSNQPWCAMFTSAAVTKGGAPRSARTASVAEVRRQAERGGGGYQQGFISAAKAKAGDLILFGNDHIGMVQSVKGGQIHYVGGNQSDAVTEATVAVGNGDIVRPRYGAR
jgi:hypothetical protein